MAYHILPPNADYRSWKVRCHETGRFHRHQTHVEEYTTALCGAEVIKDSGNYCNIDIFADLPRPSNLCRRCEERGKAFSRAVS